MTHSLGDILLFYNVFEKSCTRHTYTNFLHHITLFKALLSQLIRLLILHISCVFSKNCPMNKSVKTEEDRGSWVHACTCRTHCFDKHNQETTIKQTLNIWEAYDRCTTDTTLTVVTETSWTSTKKTLTCTHSGTPPYDHLVNTTTSLLRPLFFFRPNAQSFSYQKIPLIRPPR